MASNIWLPEIVDNIARFLPPNDIPCIIRLVDRASAAQFRDRTVMRLSLPSPAQDFRRRWATPGATRSLTLQKRQQLVALTAASGDLANLEVALESAGCLPKATMLEAAAAAGQVQACEWLRQRGCPWWHELSAAARAGQRAMCEWLLTQDGTWNVVEAACGAARSGHVGLMERLLLQESGFSSQHSWLLRAVAEGCDLATLLRLHNEWGRLGPQAVPSGYSDCLLASAARSPTPDWQAKVEWLEGRGHCGLNRSAACRAAAAGPDSLARLTWLRGRGYPADESAAVTAASAGNVASLEYLLAEGVRLQTHAACRAATYAAANGHVDVLQALHAHGCDMSPWRVLTEGAWRGGLPVVAWLVDTFSLDLHAPGRGGRPHGGVLDGAAGEGNMELLRWLSERGEVRWSELSCESAVVGGSEEALEWLVERGCPMEDNGQLYVAAAVLGDLAMLRALRRLGCPWGSRGAVFAEVAELNCSPVALLSELLEAGCPVDWDAAEEAAGRCHNDWSQTLEWLGNARREREWMAAVAQ